MALLVGDNDPGNAKTTNQAFGSGGELLYVAAGYVAVASGTATSAWIKANASGLAEYKVAVYNSSGVLLGATSAQLGAGSGVDGWNELTGLSIPITAGQTYFLGVIAEFAASLYIDSADTFNNWLRISNTSVWPTAPSDLSATSVLNEKRFPVYLDGTVSSGGQPRRSMHQYRMRRAA
jgi:hypothetical protein